MHRLPPWLISAILLSASCCSAQAKTAVPEPLPTAESIMARVALNQDASEAERTHYVYVQHAKMASRKGKTIQCEEITEYRFTPSAGETHEQLLKVEGRMLKDHKYVSYDKLLPRDDEKPKKAEDGQNPDKGKDKPSNSAVAGKDKEKKHEDKDEEDDKNDDIAINIGADGDETVDRDIVENIRWNLIHDKSKDGINAHLFPLTSRDQANYTFRMVGRERLNDHNVFHISFRPKKKDDFGWSGDAYIDTVAYQPVLITTGMARKIPFAVRTLLGTNFPGLGFTVRYAPQPDGVWFPVTFSTEFKIHVLYFFHRQVILNAENREFEKTHVTSRIVGEAAPVEAPEPQNHPEMR